ncbi:MAG: class I SAM-dependent methyltransferase [Candidatus Giovannonibacteria bacterium]|nr:class I SAM-dependent methyltransferase [Candidatus Giovannonibacteria bacterium]
MDLRETYNKIAEDWHKDHKQDNWWVEGTNKFVSLLKPNSLVLDVGCGAGTKSKYLIDKGLKVVGIDFSDKLIEIAKREAPSGNFFVMDINEADKLTEKFDGIFMQAVLLHIPKENIKKIVNKLLGRLKLGGYLYVAVKEKKSGGAEEEIKVENDYGYPYERFFSYFTLDEIKNLMIGLGLLIKYENLIQYESTKWIQVIGKK